MSGSYGVPTLWPSSFDGGREGPRRPHDPVISRCGAHPSKCGLHPSESEWTIRCKPLLVAVLMLVIQACGGTNDDGQGRLQSGDAEIWTHIKATLDDRAEALPDRTESVNPAVAEYYGTDSAKLLWVSDGTLTSRAATLIAQLDRSYEEGIDPTRFAARRFQPMDRGTRLSEQALAAAELELSEALLAYATVLLQGTERATASADWNLEGDPRPGAELLSRVAAGEPIDTIVDSIRPALPWYGPLTQALAQYRDIEACGGWPTISDDTEAFEQGDSAATIVEIRARLRAAADPEERRLAAVGASRPELMDADLAAAVAHFQSRHGIDIDSVAGPKTIAAMNVSVHERIAGLELNLDRMRRLPRDLGERAILVNIAGFDLNVLEHNESVLSMRVVVGLPEWQTAVFKDELRFLVFNPYWHVPESIEAAEVLPAVKRDPRYLTQKGFSVVAASDNFGAPVDPSTIDWSSVRESDFPYDFRQEPGPQNALGTVKFMFPNEHNIYLHDTPSRSLFRRNYRSFSHGCVRVEDPARLARYLLSVATDRSPEDVESILAKRKRTQVDLKTSVPIYLSYFTAWADHDGTVYFFQDIYGHDSPVTPQARGRRA